MTPPFLDREPRVPYDPSFLGKDSLEKRWTACLHNQVFQECWKGSHTNIDMGLLGKDSLEKEEDGMFTNTHGLLASLALGTKNFGRDPIQKYSM